jgi:hypothetical protein
VGILRPNSLNSTINCSLLYKVLGFFKIVVNKNNAFPWRQQRYVALAAALLTAPIICNADIVILYLFFIWPLLLLASA